MFIQGAMSNTVSRVGYIQDWNSKVFLTLLCFDGCTRPAIATFMTKTLLDGRRILASGFFISIKNSAQSVPGNWWLHVSVTSAMEFEVAGFMKSSVLKLL